ncbi:transporter substrate-binding domain-containing protein [uncultured Desulfobulbus sp.]|uniref:substrate-binding periplasmic protein n=1 Tax=uncultured Desulfobulbus sp. TaxID=239745 RepID=UPI0029C91629|nr:transporter substrate-binding domain-containing protein [uncultured Desulfobulbus sp.]
MRASKNNQTKSLMPLWCAVLAGLAWQTLWGGCPSVFAADASSSVLRLANGEWPPYTGRHLPGQGCDSQVVTEAFAMEGVRVEYEFLPWARGLLLSQNGVVDGAVEWAGTAEQRQTHFVNSDPLSRQEWVFFHHRETSYSWEHLDDLKDRTIGLTIGYAYNDVFADLRKQQPAMFTEAASDLLNFKKLLSGRIDLFPIERAVGYFLIKKDLSPEERAKLAEDPKPLAEFTPYLLLSRVVPGNEQRMQLFDRGLQQLKANGRYQAIMAPCSPEGQ